MFPVVVLDFLNKTPNSSCSLSQAKLQPISSNSYFLSPQHPQLLDKKAQRSAQTFVVRHFPHLRHHSVSTLNSFFGKEKSKDELNFTGTKITKENLLNISDNFQYQCEGLLEELDPFPQPLPRLRRRSDTSFWSGGQSGFEKRIGILSYEPLPVSSQKLISREPSSSNLCSKVRRAFKKAVAIQEISKAGGKRDLTRFTGVKDVREVRQRNISNSNAGQHMSKEEISKEQTTIISRVLEESRALKVPKLVNINEYKQAEDEKRFKNQNLEKMELGIGSPNKSKENKMFKELRVDTVLKKTRKSSKKKKSVQDIKSASPFNSSSQTALSRKRRVDSLGNIKSPHSLQTIRSPTNDGSQNLLDTEIFNSKGDTTEEDAETIAMLNSFGRELLPAIEEEKMEVQRRKKTNTVENIIRNISMKHTSVKSLGYLPSLRVSDRKMAQPTSLESWDNRMYLTSEISELKKSIKENPKTIKRPSKPKIGAAKVKEILTTYSHL